MACVTILFANDIPCVKSSVCISLSSAISRGGILIHMGGRPAERRPAALLRGRTQRSHSTRSQYAASHAQRHTEGVLVQRVGVRCCVWPRSSPECGPAREPSGHRVERVLLCGYTSPVRQQTSPVPESHPYASPPERNPARRNAERCHAATNARHAPGAITRRSSRVPFAFLLGMPENVALLSYPLIGGILSDEKPEIRYAS